MRKRLIVCLSMLLCGVMSASCGNKGELYLPADARLAQELEAVSERIGDIGPETDSTDTESPEDADKPRPARKQQ